MLQSNASFFKSVVARQVQSACESLSLGRKLIHPD